MALNGDVPTDWDEARQLGQLFMMGFDGTAVNDQVRTLIEDYHVGTILLTAKNLRSAAQATQLARDLQTIARDAGHPVPLLIATDQENGGVNSLYDEAYIRQFPSAMGLAATGSKKLAREVSKAAALELSSCGINFIMGPVLDVLTNSRSQPLGSRSFGDNPQEVSAYSLECLKGVKEGGLATCGKHFPSYGNLEFFGHPTDVPTITDSLEQLSQTALVPFRNAIAHGIDAMMVGGVAMANSNMTVMHACLSEQVIQGSLRQDLKFQGVVISECLEMEALSRNIGIGGGTVMAFQAGCDLILTCRSLSVQEEAINGLRSGLDNGMIEKYRIQESLDRVLKVKAKYASWDTAFAPPGIDNLTRLQPSHLNLSATAYNRSITLVRDQKQFLPLEKNVKPGDAVLLLTPLLRPLPASASARFLADRTNMPSPDKFGGLEATNASIASGESIFADFGKTLARKSNASIYHTSYTQNGLRPVHETLVTQAQAVIVVTADAGRNLYQTSFTKYVSMLCKMNPNLNGEKPCIVVAVSSPFDFLNDATIGTYLCTYDFTDVALQTLTKVLVGSINPVGSLPSMSAPGQKTSPTRQQWLVEVFEENRDTAALNALLVQAQRERSLHAGLLVGATAASFLLRSANIEEAHFVVRNSSTKELFGFCATYYYPLTGKGHIGAIIVDPERRKLSIGHSLHARAIRALLKRPELISMTLGTRLPAVYQGVPKSEANMYLRMSKWFAKLGWNVSTSQTVCSMMLTSLPGWSAPAGLGQTLANADVKFDLVHGLEYAEAVLDHVRVQAPESAQELYRMALEQQQGCGIIRAKRARDGFIQGTVIMAFRSEPSLSSHFPALNLHGAMGGILAPVISELASDQGSLMQGLVLLGVRQLKRQGADAVYLDCVEEGAVSKNLQSLGFEFYHRFDEIENSPTAWRSLSGS